MSSENHKILYLSRGGSYLRGTATTALPAERTQPGPLLTRGLVHRGGPVSEGVGGSAHARAVLGLRGLAEAQARARPVQRCGRSVPLGQGRGHLHRSQLRLPIQRIHAPKRPSAGIPSVLHIRAPIDKRMADKYRCAMATAVVAISRRVELRLARDAGIPRDKIVLIHDAVDQDLFQPGQPARTGVFCDGSTTRATPSSWESSDGWKRPKNNSPSSRSPGNPEENREGHVLYHRGSQGPLLPRPDHGEIRRRPGRSCPFHRLPGRYAGGSGRAGRPGQPVGRIGTYEAMMCGIPVVCAWSRAPRNPTAFGTTTPDSLCPTGASTR